MRVMMTLFLSMMIIINGCTTSLTAMAASHVESGKTLLLIGQTFQQEYEDYINGIGTAPAGSSHYAEIYTGTINQGDDGKFFDDSAPYLNWISQHYPQATALIAISIKDNPMSGGYGALTDDNPSCVYHATRDIAYTTKWDDNIIKLANKFKQYPNITFFVRIGYEVNLLMMANASGQKFTDVLDKYNALGINIFDDIALADPADIDVKAYHDAYNKMARMIRDEQGASNVKFVYHPVRGFGEVKALYPGDTYVDYIGFSTFNHDLSVGTDEPNEFVRTIGYDGSRLDSNLEQSLTWASAKKPIIIAEAAYQKAPPEWASAVGSSHSHAFLEYLDRLFEVIEQYDIRALTYINSDWIAHHWPSHWGDSRVEAFPDVKAYWIDNVINNPRYVHDDGTVSPTPSGNLIGPYTNSETKFIDVTLTTSGMYRLDVTGDTGVVSQLISATLGTSDGGMAALNEGTVSSIYFHGIQPGTMPLTLTSKSDHVALAKVTLFDPNNQEVILQ